MPRRPRNRQAAESAALPGIVDILALLIGNPGAAEHLWGEPVTRTSRPAVDATRIRDLMEVNRRSALSAEHAAPRVGGEALAQHAAKERAIQHEVFGLADQYENAGTRDRLPSSWAIGQLMAMAGLTPTQHRKLFPMRPTGRS